VKSVLEDNESLNKTLEDFNLSKKEFFKIKVNNVELNAWKILPSNFDKTKKYPVLMFVYGGPGINTVNDSWDGGNTFWFQHLASKGYIIVSVDNRGTGSRGEAFKKITYKELGKYETEDQIASAKYLRGSKLAGFKAKWRRIAPVDAKRRSVSILTLRTPYLIPSMICSTGTP